MRPSNLQRPTWSPLQLTFVLREVGGECPAVQLMPNPGPTWPVSLANICIWRLWGGPAESRPIHPQGPQSHLRCRDCGEDLQKAGPYTHIAHRAVSDVETVRRTRGKRDHTLTWPTRPSPM